MAKNYFAFLAVLSFMFGSAQTVGLLQHDSQSLDDGYVLFAPLQYTTTYLIDKCGRQAKTWNSTYKPGSSVYLLPDGTLLRPGNVNSSIFNAGGTGGIIEKIDWDGNVIWSYQVSDVTKCQHHDVKALPNGNILVIAWEAKTAAEAIASGRDPGAVGASVWSEQVLEIQPVGTNGGNIVWEWHLWDHLIQNFDSSKPNYNADTANPRLLNINFNATSQADWIHLNSIDYNPVLDQIVLSSFALSEIWIIDHSTTTAEAASHSGGNSGHGGDFLYRFGQPPVYGSPSGNLLFNGQHNAHWIENGLPFASQIMVHNNGNGRIGGNYSTVEIINAPVDGYNYNAAVPFLPEASSWTYNASNPNNYYAPFVSSAQQLPNGNVLICNGPSGVFFEVTPSGETVWKYANPVNDAGAIAQGEPAVNTVTFRCSYYPFDFSGFAGHSLTSGNTIENENPISAACSLNLAVVDHIADGSPVVFPNPAKDILNVRVPDEFVLGNVTLTNSIGQTIHSSKMNSNTYAIPVESFSSGLYYLKITADNRQFIKKIVIE